MPALSSIDDAVPVRGRPRSEASSDAVLEAAFRLTADVGLKGATVEAIAARSGVSKMTIYKWWGGRMPLLIDAFLREATRVLPLATDIDPVRALHAHAARYVEALEGDLGTVMRAAIADCMAQTGDAALFYERYLSHRRDLGMAVIRRGQREGRIIATRPAPALYDQIYGTIFYRFLFGLPGLDRRFVKALIDATLTPEDAA